MTLILEIARSTRSAGTLPDATGRNKLNRTTHMGLDSAAGQTMRVMAALMAAVLAALAPAAAQILPAAAPAAFGQALEAWAATQGIARAFIVVRRDGRTIHKSALGGANPDAPVHLASLSK